MNTEFGARYFYAKPSYPFDKGAVRFDKQSTRFHAFATKSPPTLKWQDRNIDPRSPEAKANIYDGTLVRRNS